MAKKNKRNKHYRLQKGKLMEIVGRTEETKTEVAAKSTDENALNFALEIPDEIFQKVMWWINKADHEVSGFGSVEFDERKNAWRVTDVILLKQEVGPTSTEIDPVSLGKAMYRLKDTPNGLKWHWHSHVNMGVFWSADDRELIRSLGQRGWILATVFNKKREMLSAFHTQVEVMGRRHDIFQDKVNTFVQRYLPEDLCKSLDAEYDDNVKTVATPTYTQRNYDYHGGYSGYYKGKVWLNGEWVDEDYGTTVQNTLDEKRWQPEEKMIMADEYDEWGYVKVGDSYWYNPCYDDEMRSENQKLDAIADMTPQEVDFMQKRSPTFELLLKKFIVLEATRPVPTVPDEAAELFVEA